jgi:hypothetical protein
MTANTAWARYDQMALGQADDFAWSEQRASWSALAVACGRSVAVATVDFGALMRSDKRAGPGGVLAPST